MDGFELRTSGVRNDHSANCVTTSWLSFRVLQNSNFFMFSETCQPCFWMKGTLNEAKEGPASVCCHPFRSKRLDLELDRTTLRRPAKIISCKKCTSSLKVVLKWGDSRVDIFGFFLFLFSSKNFTKWQKKLTRFFEINFFCASSLDWLFLFLRFYDCWKK